MALRNPVYLDMETLAAQADYHEIRYPVPTEIVEKSTQGRSGEASAQIAGVGLRGKGGKDVELQKSFTLAPKDKAVVSRVLDSLIEEGHARTQTADGFSRDDLVELEGESFLHQGSLVGKLMHIALLAMKHPRCVGQVRVVGKQLGDRHPSDAAGGKVLQGQHSTIVGGDLPRKAVERDCPGFC